MKFKFHEIVQTSAAISYITWLGWVWSPRTLDMNMCWLKLAAIGVLLWMIISEAAFVVEDDNEIIDLAFDNYYRAANLSGE